MCFRLLLDLLLLAGLVYFVTITIGDWDYWQTAPNNFGLFLLVQYVLLASVIRLPITRKLSHYAAVQATGYFTILLLVNTGLGIKQLLEITSIEVEASPQNESLNIKRVNVSQDFELKESYLVNGVILILVPCSIAVFLAILLVKVLCFLFVENQRGVRRNIHGYYFSDEDYGSDRELVE